MWNLRPGCKIIDDMIKKKVKWLLILELLNASIEGQVDEITNESGIAISTRFRICEMEVGAQSKRQKNTNR